MNEQEIRRIIGEEIRAYLGNEKFVFPRHLALLDGRNIQTGKTTGTIIATETSQSLGFHGTAGTTQRASGNQAALSLNVSLGGADTIDRTSVQSNFSSIQTLLNELRTVLVNKGIIKGSA